MHVHTMNVVVGSKACQARCPFCVSKMTPDCGLRHIVDPNMRNFNIACRYAERCGVSTVLFTGKGEPLLAPDQLTAYLSELEMSPRPIFPLMELQTNGIKLFDHDFVRKYLGTWYHFGLTTVSLSIAHYDPKRNAEIFGMNYDPFFAVDILHDHGFSVRINCTMCKDYVDSPVEVEALLERCREYRVEQVTLRPVTLYEGGNQDVVRWVKDHTLTEMPFMIQKYLEDNGAECLLWLAHGAIVYDYKGGNVCLNNCLTNTEDPDDIRQLIYYPDGHLRFSWTHEGSVIF